jgi:hypothetical protein
MLRRAKMKKVMIYYIITTIVLLFVVVGNAVALETTISDGTPGPTYTVTASNTVAGISASVLTYLGVTAKGAIITVETYGIRIAFGGTTPTIAGLGHYIEAGGGLRIYGSTALANFKYINYVTSNNAVLQITPLY